MPSDLILEESLLNKQQLEAILEASLDAIMVFQVDGTILSANEGATQMFGYHTNELVGLHLVDLMPDEFVSAERRALAEHGQTSMVHLLNRTINREGKKASGERFPFKAYVHEVGDDVPRRYIVVAEDRTAIHKSHQRILALHEELQQTNGSLEDQVAKRTHELEVSIKAVAGANGKLAREIREREDIARSLQQREVQLERLLYKERELNDLKTRFVSMASHEFRTPLTTMLSSLEVISMASGEVTPIVGKHLERIRTNIGHLRSVLDDFLQLGRIELKGVDLNIQTFDFADLVEELLDDLKIASKPEQALHIELEGAFGKTRQLKNGLRVILTNLTSNAIKYSPSHAAVTIRIAREADRLCIAVSDLGIGIPPQDKGNLFERFFRASNAVTLPGTGLGLHITKQYVIAMGGSIRVEDNPVGVGTVFTVNLPYSLP